MNFTDLPAIGQPLEAGIFAGVTTLSAGIHHAVILLADKPATGLTWKKAMNWAEKLDAQLPSRPISAMLFANLKAQFEPNWHWTNESFDSSYAWVQSFDYGDQVINITDKPATATSIGPDSPMRSGAAGTA